MSGHSDRYSLDYWQGLVHDLRRQRTKLEAALHCYQTAHNRAAYLYNQSETCHCATCMESREALEDR